MTMQAWVIGNWKQNPKSIEQVNALLQDLRSQIASPLSESQESESQNPLLTHCQLMVAPSTVHLQGVAAALAETPIAVAAQDVCALSQEVGAYTGDSSAAQLADAGASWCLVGHSERRQYYQEDNAVLADKISHLLAQNVGVILCVGESLTEYQDQQTLAVLEKQLAVLTSADAARSEQIINQASQLIVAYEPIWAIGTGKVPTVAEVDAAHTAIKAHLAAHHPALAVVPVLYGGSVNADNAAGFAECATIDGALVGGASLVAESFLKIAAAFDTAKGAA